MAESSNGGVTGLIERVFSVGIPAYVDLQTAKNYRPNDPSQLGIQNPDGTYTPAGQAAQTSLASAVANVPSWVWLAAIGGVAAIVFVIAKK